MSPTVPYGVRALALSHARAWPTAAWTGLATAFAAGLDLSLAHWLLLGGLAVVCGSAVRMTSAQLVGAWLAHADASDVHPVRSGVTASDYDAATLEALRALVPPSS